MTTLLALALPIMGCFATLVAVIWWQGRKNNQLKQRNQQLQQQTKAQQQVINNVQVRKTIRHQNATVARAELDARLSKHGYYRD